LLIGGKGVEGGEGVAWEGLAFFPAQKMPFYSIYINQAY